MKRGFVRSLPVLLVTAGLVASLTACASDTGYSGCAHYDSGDASSIIDVAGNVGKKPSVDFPTPIVVTETQATEVVVGEGEPLTVGQPARVELSIYNGTTGTELQSTPFDGQGLLTTVGESGVTAALECATVGSRIVLAASAQDSHQGQPNPNLGVKADDTYIIVLDVLEAYLAKADGAPQAPAPGMPVVVTAPNGAPGITIPKTGGSSVAPPEELQVSVLQRGDGEKVTEGSRVVVHYTGVLWSTNKEFDSTWNKNGATVFELNEASVVKGFLDGLVGQTVGSQVLLVVPPELGYGEAANGSIPAGSTLVFVVDILGQYEK